MKKLKKIKSPSLGHPITAALIGQAVKARRTQSKLRLEDAAALCGVAKQTFMNIEHGQPTCQLKSVLQVCAGLGIQIHITPWQQNDETDDDWT